MSSKGYKIHILILILMIVTMLKKCLSENDVKHKARIDYKLLEEHVFEETSSKSLAGCLIYCSLQQDCISVSFKSPTENCLLSSYDTIDDSFSNPGIPKGLIYADGWTTLTRIRYPVFHVLGENNRYSMTFAQAIQRCIDHGTTIATPSDVLQAQSMGYAYCACSWMSDGKNGLVVQKYIAACGFGGFGETIDYCYYTYADVYCKLKLSRFKALSSESRTGGGFPKT